MVLMAVTVVGNNANQYFQNPQNPHTFEDSVCLRVNKSRMWCCVYKKGGKNQSVRGLTGAAQRVGGTQTVVASLTAVTAGAFHIYFTLTGACTFVTPALILCPLSTADTTCKQHNNTNISHFKKGQISMKVLQYRT